MKHTNPHLYLTFHPSYTPRKIETRCGKIPSDCFSWATRERPFGCNIPTLFCIRRFIHRTRPARSKRAAEKYSWIAFDGRLERGSRFYQRSSKFGVWRFPTCPQGQMGMFKCHNEFAYLQEAVHIRTEPQFQYSSVRSVPTPHIASVRARSPYHFCPHNLNHLPVNAYKLQNTHVQLQ